VAVVKPPYREKLFSSRGSVLWAGDQINLAANTWSQAALEREFISQPAPHKSFVPTEFPTPPTVVRTNAKRFVCDVLTKKSGRVNYPLRSNTHPPLEQRMQQVAEALRAIAEELPQTDGSSDYQPVSQLQAQLGDIFSVIYRETGVYNRAIHKEVCTLVNSDEPVQGCAK
jgi:hypothetical protein